MKPVKYLFFLLLILPTILYAQELPADDSDEKDIIIITEKRTRTDTAAGQKTVIEQETWERKGARTVAEAVHLTPGVTVSRSGTTLEASTVSIRGSGGEQVLIMVNGVPLNNGKGDPVNLSSLSLKNVKKIEVIRGGNSAVYGEGAFGGVINIITDDTPSYVPEGDFSLSGGAFQTWTAGGWLKGPLSPGGTLTGNLSGEGRYTGGEFDYPSQEGNLTRVNSRGWAVNGKGGFLWNIGGLDRHVFSLDASAYSSDRGVPGIMEFLTPEAELRETRLGSTLRYRFEGYTGLAVDSEFAFLNQTSDYENPDASVDEEHLNRSFRGRSDLSGTIETGSWSFSPLAGTVLSYDTLNSTSLRSSSGTTLPGEADQLSSAVYARVEASGSRLSVTPALRWDFSRTAYRGWEERQDNKGSWSVTAALTPGKTDRLSLKGNIGTAYHSPGFDDLFWSGGSFASGNPDLLPEESFNWDGGIYLKPLKGLELSSVYFQSYTDNLIQWFPSPGGTWRPDNIGKVHTQGLENALTWLIPLKEESLTFLEVRGGYTWMTAREQTDGSINAGNQLPYRPVHAADASLSLIRNRHSLTVTSRYMGYRYTNMANTKYLDDVLTFDSVLKVAFDGGFYGSFSVLNIGNIQYVDKLGYPVPGREWTLSGGYNF